MSPSSQTWCARPLGERLLRLTTDINILEPTTRNVLFKRAFEIYLCKMREQNFEGLTQWKRHNGKQVHIVTTEAMGTFWAAATETLFGRPIWGRLHGAGR